MFAAIIFSLIFLGITIGVLCFGRKQSWSRGTQFLVAVSGILSVGIGFLTITSNVNFLWGIFLVFILLCIIVFRESGEKAPTCAYLSLLVVVIYTVVVLIPVLAIYDSTRYEHEVFVEYNVTFNEGINITVKNMEDVPDVVYNDIRSKAELMKDAEREHYEGLIRVKYICDCPKLDGAHDECACTKNSICDLCSEYITEVEIGE